MTKKLDNRIKSCLDEMYRRADNVFGIKDLNIGFDELDSLLKVMIDNGDFKKGTMMLELFYLPMDDYEEIIRKHCKGLRWSWRWPRRTMLDDDGKIIEDKEWEEYYAEYKKMQAKLENKEIKLKEFNAWNNEMGKKYGMTRRCYDAEVISFNAMNYSPNSNEDKFNEISRIIDGIEGMNAEEATAYMKAYGANEHIMETVLVLLPFKQYLLDFKNGKYESIREK